MPNYEIGAWPSVHEELAALGRVRTSYELARAIERLALLMGFEWFLLLDTDPGLREVATNINNAPGVLRAWHSDHNAMRLDPVVSRALQECIPFAWDAATYADADATDSWRMLAGAGYRSGLAARACDVRDQACVLLLSTGRPIPVVDEHRMLAIADLLTATSHVQAALERVAPRAQPKLRPRELECLRWCIEGKTAKETGRLMGISERTVNQHLGRAMEQLGVTSKVSAVTRAHKLGLLPPGSLLAAASRPTDL